MSSTMGADQWVNDFTVTSADCAHIARSPWPETLCREQPTASLVA